ncbi:MAG: DMT family transporter [Actinobacteria bacterium]|nr:DMT family transporter [Actinomycetota bacterium]
MDAVLLASCSAVLFGAMTIVLRLALRRTPDAQLGALATIAVALAVAGSLALLRGLGGVSGADVVPFVVAGVLAPGASQLLFTLAVRDAGASRTSVLTGVAPLLAVAIALVALDEPLEAPLLAGALLIVVGGAALAFERVRPEGFKPIGALFAIGGATTFAIRDNAVRALSDETTVDPALGAAITLATGGTVMLAYLVATRGGRLVGLARAGALSFVPVGLLFGLSYVTLFEAYYRGRVSVVSPIVATESLWGVLLSALLLRRSELVGRRLVAGAALIVAGGALIGAFR